MFVHYKTYKHSLVTDVSSIEIAFIFVAMFDMAFLHILHTRLNFVGHPDQYLSLSLCVCTQTLQTIAFINTSAIHHIIKEERERETEKE